MAGRQAGLYSQARELKGAFVANSRRLRGLSQPVEC